MSIKIPVEAKLNQQDISAQIQQIEAALNDLGRVAQQAGRISFSPISKTSLEDARRMKSEFEAMVRMAPGLKRALENGGQGGKSFGSIDWDKVWTDPKQRAGHAESLVRRLRPGAAAPLPPAAAGAGGSGGHGGRGGRTDQHDDHDDRPPSAGGAWRKAAGGAAAGVAGGAASQIGGVGGGVVSGALSGALVGGPIGAAVGGLAGAITSLLGSIGEARDVAISLDTLKRALGDTNVSFTALQAQTHDLANVFSLTDPEAVGLTSRYARLSGSDKDLDSLRDEVGVGVGFSRSFGLEPSAGVDFFGQMKGLGITKGADDNKRLALMIGESVAKAGELPRMGDVMAGLSRYLEGTAVRSLTSGNSEAWLAKLAGLSNSDLPGTSPGASANMLATADAAVSQGGITPAGKNFMNGQIQKELGLNTIQAAMQLEGGLFGTGKATFGPGSAMGAYYAKNGVEAPEAANSSKTNMEILLGAMERQYKDRPDLMLDAMKAQFGLSYGQAAAWQTSGSAKVGGLASRLKRLGIDPSQVNGTGISELSQIEADDTLSDAQKDVRAKETAGKNQEDTVGSEARRASIDGSNAMVRLASEGLPMLSSIQAGVLKLAGLDAPKSPDQRARDIEHQSRIGLIEADLGKKKNEAWDEYSEKVPFWKRGAPALQNPEEQALGDKYWKAKKEFDDAISVEDKEYKKKTLDNAPADKPEWRAVDRSGSTTRNGTVPRNAADDDHKARMDAITAKEGGILAKAKEEYGAAVPSGTRDLTDDQLFAKDRVSAAQDDYDSAVAAEKSRYAAAAASKTPATRSDKLELGSFLADKPDLVARLAKEDEELGHRKGTAAAQLWQESRFKGGAVSSQGALGHSQMMPENVAELSKRAGRQLDPGNFEDALTMRRMLMKDNQADPNIGHNLDRELMAYYGGASGKAWGPKTRQYPNDVKRWIDQVPGADRVPAGTEANENDDQIPAIERRKREMEVSRRDQSMNVHVHQSGEFVLRDTSGNQVAQADVQTDVGKPRVSGL